MPENPSDEPPADRPFPIRGYLILNALVWAFCLLLIPVVRWQIGDLTGVVFFLVIIPIGFGVVSVFDAIYDRVGERRPARGQGPGAEE